ncbi:hypothetical protein B0J17DRAFT_763484 [Rhizoctonia solani]|nr:hypothetical protein B0J17DRAFT_763484 [Rhizoctonia solani]
MSPQIPSETSLPFFDVSARRVRLPQPTSSPARVHSQPGTVFLSQKSFKAHASRRTASHTQLLRRARTSGTTTYKYRHASRGPRSPPLTPPPVIQASLPSTPGNYSLRLEPVTSNEAAQAAVVFPDLANPQRALLLVGPAIARYVRERGKSARMHPYRVVFRPSP